MKSKIKSTAIAPDAISPQNSNTPYYEVTIEPEQTYLVKSDRISVPEEYLANSKPSADEQCCQANTLQYPIQPGMEITADIISNQETVLTFILRKARLLTDL